MRKLALILTLIFITLARVAPTQAMYDPSIGVWISRDPIGEKGGLNLYSAFGNDPINKTDPLGLDVVNNSTGTVYVKPETGSTPIPVAPGETYKGNQDGVTNPSNPGTVVKTVDNIDATVNKDGTVTTSGGSILEKLGQAAKGGEKDADWLLERQKKNDSGWDPLFEKAGVSKEDCEREKAKRAKEKEQQQMQPQGSEPIMYGP